MANRNFTPVMFGLEKNLVFLTARIVFNPNGIPVLDAMNSKGVCAVKLESETFTGATTNSTDLIGSISNFTGIYPGMTIVGSTGSLQANTRIIDRSPTGSLRISNQAILTGLNNTLTVTGGRLLVQFGTEEAMRLDAYNRLLGMSYVWEETTSSALSITSAQFFPGAPDMFIVANNIARRTVPPTATNNSTDCSIAIQMGHHIGSGSGVNSVNFFRATNPLAGEVLKLQFVLSNSTAV